MTKDTLTPLAKKLAGEMQNTWCFDSNAHAWLKKSPSGNSWEHKQFGPEQVIWQALMDAPNITPTKDIAAEIDMRLRVLLPKD